jgi:MoxR-like ATPase
LEKEIRIIRARVPDAGEQLANQIARFMQQLRTRRLAKVPGAAETIDWARALVTLHRDALDVETVEQTLGVILKDHHDAAELDAVAVKSLVEQATAEAR